LPNTLERSFSGNAAAVTNSLNSFAATISDNRGTSGPLTGNFYNGSGSSPARQSAGTFSLSGPGIRATGNFGLPLLANAPR
jgi:hypothetical protein